MKYEAIRTQSSNHSVRKMCLVLGLKESAYYQWLFRLHKKIVRRQACQELTKKVKEVFDASQKTYGYRKMQRALVKEGCYLGEYKVRKIMRENGFFPVVTYKYRPARGGKQDGRFFEDKLKQQFTTEYPNTVWAGDITYIKTKIGFVYCAAVIDLYNREVVGYNISKNLDAELVKTALSNAVGRRSVPTGQLIFHSDRGTQYSSKTYQSMLIKYGITGSMSRPSCPYDNACVESFFGSAKKECIYRKEYDNIEEVKHDVFKYIELFYNRKRLHASLGYLSPVEYRLSKMAS